MTTPNEIETDTLSDEKRDVLWSKAGDMAEAWGTTLPENRFGAAFADGKEIVGTVTVTADEIVTLIYAVLTAQEFIVEPKNDD